MKHPPSLPETGPEPCARRMLEVVPLVMRVIRREMRGAMGEQLSVPQFRLMAFLGRHGGTSLSAVARHLGVADATASTMVERLVRRGLVSRGTHPEERRRVALDLTAEGSCLLAHARTQARTYLAGRLASLDEAGLAQLQEGLDLMAAALDPGEPRETRS